MNNFIRVLHTVFCSGGYGAFELFYTADAEEFKDIISKSLRSVYGVESKDAGILVPYEGAYDIKRRQYDAHGLLDHLLRVMRSEHVLWAIDRDMYYDGLNFVMGLAMFHLGAVVSTYRLDSATLVAKEAVHEAGHVLGLQHCSNECVMQFSSTIEAAKKKPGKLCARCESLLNRKIIETRPPL